MRELLSAAGKRPGMYIGRRSFRDAVAFVSGFDLALPDDQRFLDDFRTWLTGRVAGNGNLGWDALFLLSTGADRGDVGRSWSRPDDYPFDESEELAALLFKTLDEFLSIDAG